MAKTITVETVETVGTNANGTKKLTKVEKFDLVTEFLVENKASQELMDFIAHERELVERKNARKTDGKKSLTKAQKENLELASVLTKHFNGMEDVKLGLNTNEIGEILGMPLITSQKVTAIMKLVENVEKGTKDKKVAYFWNGVTVEVEKEKAEK